MKLVYKIAFVFNIETMSAIRKSRKKYDAKSAFVIKQLAISYEVTDVFVRLAVRGDRDSETAVQIKKEYNRLMKAIDNALK